MLSSLPLSLLEIKRSIVLFLLVLLSLGLLVQGKDGNPDFGSNPIGLPFIDNYSSEEFQFHPQNWCIEQDPRGILFFANTQGLLEFDGVNWRRHELIAGSSITVLKHDGEKRLYLGGRGDFGYFEFDSTNGYRYTSLGERIPEDQQALINTIWNIVIDEGAVYFRSNRAIFRFQGEALEVIPGAFTFLEKVGDVLYLLQKEHGLQRMREGEIEDVESGASLQDVRLYSGLPFDDSGKVLFASPTDGCFVFEPGVGVKDFDTEAEAFLMDNRIYRGNLIQIGQQRLFAYATYNGGVVVFDRAGSIVQVLNKESGLPGDKAHYVLQDRDGALWISLNSGIARVEFPSPFSIFDERLGLEGLPKCAEYYNETLFVGTSVGLFQLKNARDEEIIPWSRFEPIEGYHLAGEEKLSTEIWSMLSYDGSLWVGDARYVHRIVDGKIVESFDCQNSVYSILPLPDQNAILLGGAQGVWVLVKENGDWKLSGKISDSINTVWSMVKDDQGRIWLGTPASGVIRLYNLDPRTASGTITRYGKDEGVPESWLHVSEVDGRLVVVPETGLYRYDLDSDAFVPDELADALGIDMDEQVSHLTEGVGGRLWMMRGADEGGICIGILKEKGRYDLDTQTMKRLVDVKSLLEIQFDPHAPDTAWILTRDGKIYRYDSHAGVQVKRVVDFVVAVRNVQVIDTDEMFWYGDAVSDDPMRAVPFRNNDLKFSYAATVFIEPGEVQYQVMLEGYQKAWSRWTKDTYKDYTGIPGGEYTFNVRAKDVLGRVSEVKGLPVVVLSPWYLKAWAYLLYSLVFVTFVYLMIRWRVNQFKRKADELEGIVQERTAEIARQSEELKEMDRIKSHFFANISHEFRTPLTLILGPVESTLQQSDDPGVVKKMDVVRRNAYRLKRLIDQLLYLSKLEAKQLKLRVHHGDLQMFVRQVVQMFSSAAEQREIDLSFVVVTELEKEAYFDPDVVEKVIYNLLSNALKFTPEGGQIIVSFEGASDVFIRVSDTGCGIPAEQVPNIFDRFYQNEKSKNSFQEGTGIGMALTRELLELHRGEIFVESSVDEGSTFTVRLPIDIRIFESCEIVDGAVDKEIDAHIDMNELIPEKGMPEAEVDPGGEEKLILIVEDHEQVRDYIKEHLVENYRVLEASNGVQGLQLALETIPDLIISDVMMPEMDGFELCDQIKQNEKVSHIPVILLTARAGDESRMEGWETGADDYLTKPFNARELNVRIRKLIEQREYLRMRFRKEGILTLKDETLPSAEEAFLKKLLQVVESNLSDERFGVDELGKQLGLGRRQLLRKLQASTGQTAIAFLRTIRLRKAKKIIESRSHGSITEVAYEVGFSSLSYFARMFKAEYGVNPSELLEKSE